MMAIFKTSLLAAVLALLLAYGTQSTVARNVHSIDDRNDIQVEYFRSEKLAEEQTTTEKEPSTPEPSTTEVLTTVVPTTAEPLTTLVSTTAEPLTTVVPTTAEPLTTLVSTTAEPLTTVVPTTAEPLTTVVSTTQAPTTPEPTTPEPTTPEPTTPEPTTPEPTTPEPTTPEPTTPEPTTPEPTTPEPTTPEPTTPEPTTPEPTTPEPTTPEPTTPEPTTPEPTTPEPTTPEPTTPEPTTPEPTTPEPTTPEPTTPEPTTPEPTTPEPTTPEPTTTEKPTPHPFLTTCPSFQEFGSNLCTCFSLTSAMLCSHFSGSFVLDNYYRLNELAIELSDQTELALPAQLLTSKQLSFLSLDILTNFNLQRIDPQMFQLVIDRLHIANNHNLESIDWSQLPNQLTSISIDSVKSLLDFNKNQKDTFPNLNELHLHNVHFGPTDGATDGTDLTIDKLQYPSLKTLVITHTNLGGKVRFEMGDNSQDCGEYRIDLPHNNLRYFDFGALFPSNTSSNSADCHRFVVNLSQNSHTMDPKLLIDQIPVLARYAPHITAHFEGLHLDCNCDLYKLYHHRDPVIHHSFRENFHGIYCTNHHKTLLTLLHDEVC